LWRFWLSVPKANEHGPDSPEQSKFIGQGFNLCAVDDWGRRRPRRPLRDLKIMSMAASTAESTSGNQVNNSSVGFTGRQMLLAIVAVIAAGMLYLFLKRKN
jgi:hypothetical protein